MAAKCVKVFQRSLLKTGILKDTATYFCSCITLGARWSSTSPEPKTKLQKETENLGDIIHKPGHKRMHVDDIRSLCKTDQTPREVSKLFNRFLELPDQFRTESVSSALYWFCYYNKIDEALELKTFMEKHGIPKSYSTYAPLADLYSRSSQLGNMKDFFEEMARDGLTPRARHYAPFVDTAVKKGDLIGAFHYVSEMQQSAFAHERSVDKYKFLASLIRACAGEGNKQLTNKVLELFREFIKYRDLLRDDTLEAVKLWFDSQEKPEWITAWTSTSATYHCKACKEKLETGEFSAVELEDLKHPLVKHLWKKHKARKQVRCFTSAGNYIDFFGPSQRNQFPQSIEQFIRTTGPYDVVIDGLNVAYFPGSFDARKVENVVLHFVKQNKRVLVVGSSPLRLPARTKKGEETSLSALMNYLTDHDQCGVFCVAESSMDDFYFLSAAMHCGPGTLVVSCDRFCDHIRGMDPLVKPQFRRWQNLNQMELERFVGDNPVFATKKPFDAAVQTTGDAWHFPSSSGNRWLCVRKAGN